MTQSAGDSRKRAERCLPAFAQRRLDSYYIDRVQHLWGGDHLLHGATPPPMPCC